MVNEWISACRQAKLRVESDVGETKGEEQSQQKEEHPLLLVAFSKLLCDFCVQTLRMIRSLRGQQTFPVKAQRSWMGICSFIGVAALDAR